MALLRVIALRAFVRNDTTAGGDAKLRGSVDENAELEHGRSVTLIKANM